MKRKQSSLVWNMNDVKSLTVRRSSGGNKLLLNLFHLWPSPQRNSTRRHTTSWQRVYISNKLFIFMCLILSQQTQINQRSFFCFILAPQVCDCDVLQCNIKIKLSLVLLLNYIQTSILSEVQKSKWFSLIILNNPSSSSIIPSGFDPTNMKLFNSSLNVFEVCVIMNDFFFTFCILFKIDSFLCDWILLFHVVFSCNKWF